MDDLNRFNFGGPMAGSHIKPSKRVLSDLEKLTWGELLMLGWTLEAFCNILAGHQFTSTHLVTFSDFG